MFPSSRFRTLLDWARSTMKWTITMDVQIGNVYLLDAKLPLSPTRARAHRERLRELRARHGGHREARACGHGGVRRGAAGSVDP